MLCLCTATFVFIIKFVAVMQCAALGIALNFHNCLRCLHCCTGVDAHESGTKIAMQEARQTAQDLAQPEPLSDEALRCYKEGLVDLLRPGESVLSALRRLGNPQVGCHLCTLCIRMICKPCGLMLALTPLGTKDSARCALLRSAALPGLYVGQMGIA